MDSDDQDQMVSDESSRHVRWEDREEEDMSYDRGAGEMIGTFPTRALD